MTSWARLQADFAGGLDEGIARVGPRATSAPRLLRRRQRTTARIVTLIRQTVRDCGGPMPSASPRAINANRVALSRQRGVDGIRKPNETMWWQRRPCYWNRVRICFPILKLRNFMEYDQQHYLAHFLRRRLPPLVN